MYSSYICEFDKNVALLEEQCRKSPAFAKVVQEFEVMKPTQPVLLCNTQTLVAILSFVSFILIVFVSECSQTCGWVGGWIFLFTMMLAELFFFFKQSNAIRMSAFHVCDDSVFTAVCLYRSNIEQSVLCQSRPETLHAEAHSETSPVSASSHRLEMPFKNSLQIQLNKYYDSFKNLRLKMMDMCFPHAPTCVYLQDT